MLEAQLKVTCSLILGRNFSGIKLSFITCTIFLTLMNRYIHYDANKKSGWVAALMNLIFPSAGYIIAEIGSKA